MEQIKILFFVLSSFFGIENGRIAADKTTITVYPESKEIEIIQEKLFTVIQSEKDSILTIKEWNKLQQEKNNSWSDELNRFPVKSLSLNPIKNTIQPHLILKYTTEEDLQILGIWHNKKKNLFSINHIPQQNINTNDGTLDGNFWFFDGNNKFSFTIEPFQHMPEKYLKFKKSLEELLTEKK